MGFISLDDAKETLRVDTEADDALIAALIAAADGLIEAVTGHVAEKRAGEIFAFDGFTRELRLPLRPIDTGTIAVSYIDPAGEAQSVEDFRAFERHGFTCLAPAFGTCWPATARLPRAVTVTADTGYGDPDTARETLKQAARICVRSWYDAPDAELPAPVALLLAPERPGRV